MSETAWFQRLRYRFDNTMSKGPIALIGWLFIASLIFLIAISAAEAIAGVTPEGSDRLTFLEAFWLSLMRTLDAGTMGGDAGWPFRLASLLVTLGGIFLISTLIGVLTSGIENKLEDLRKGRSVVIEKDHIVILGWSSQVFSIISELVIANENQKSSCIAILADKDKVEMEDAIRSRVPDAKRTRIVCRTGSPMDLADLEIINPRAAKAIIILAPEVDDPDTHVIKTILALTNNPNRRKEPYHLVAELRDSKNMEVARLVGRGEAQLVLAADLISRIAVQTCRQSGLSVVYTELLDFGGDEIYFKEEPALVGKSFGEALLAYEDSAVIGLQFNDAHVQLNPPMHTRIAAGDKVIAISEDDDTIRLSGAGQPPLDVGAIRAPRAHARAPERTLILGWNGRATSIICELDNYVAPGSAVDVVADAPEAEAIIAEQCAGLLNQAVGFRRGETTDRRTLASLDLHVYDHAIVLGYSDSLRPQEADAKTLITLLHLRDLSERGGYDFSIVSEMLDVRNRELAEVTRADDFIVSDKLVSLMLSQICENKYLAPVFDDLFDPQGSELYLKPIEDYVETGRPVNFYTIVEAARRRGEIAIGYRLKAEADDSARSHGVVINPDKSKMVMLAEKDRVIVLAES